MTIGEPTYYTRHPDDTYSVADPQPSVQQVDLTDDEIETAKRCLLRYWAEITDEDLNEFARAVIAAFKEKNK